MSDKTGCARENCKCPTGTEDEFCGDHCRAADGQDLSEITCDCGCPGCK